MRLAVGVKPLDLALIFRIRRPRTHVPSVATAGPPDLDVAVGAILPAFLAFLDGNLRRSDEEGRDIPPKQ